MGNVRDLMSSFSGNMATSLRGGGVLNGHKKSCPAEAKQLSITPQGLEPQISESESDVLPITPRGSVGSGKTAGRGI